MDEESARRNLATIRTLMERSALYRRAMGPVMLVVGATGVLAAIIGAVIQRKPPLPALGYWLIIAAICLVETSWLIRLQALKQGEEFWSAPMRRVTQAVLPAFVAGLAAALPFACDDVETRPSALLVVPAWMILYGIATHSAGFFMTRSFKIFGWSYVAGGVVVFGVLIGLIKLPSLAAGVNNLDVHLAMGTLFGLPHLTYGLFLYLTESKQAVA